MGDRGSHPVRPRFIVPYVAQQTEHRQLAASSPSRPRRPGAGAAGGSGSRRGFQCGARRSRRWSECRKSLQAPGLDVLRRPTRGGECVQEEGGYEYASYKHSAEGSSQESHIEPATLYQPLGGEEGAGEGTALPGATTQLCKPGSEGPCTHPIDGAENGYCLSVARHHRSPGRCVKNAAWQKRMGRREKPAGPLEKCLFGAATYGLVGLVFDVVSPEGAAATCVLAMLGP